MAAPMPPLPNSAPSPLRPPIFLICFIARPISWCIFSTLLTVCTSVPEPAATRFLRLAFINAGFLRSLGVIEPMIASMWTSTLSSMLEAAIAALAFFMPGSIPASMPSPPMLCICFNCMRRSSRSNWPLAIFLASASASSA